MVWTVKDGPGEIDFFFFYNCDLVLRKDKVNYIVNQLFQRKIYFYFMYIF